VAEKLQILEVNFHGQAPLQICDFLPVKNIKLRPAAKGKESLLKELTEEIEALDHIAGAREKFVAALLEREAQQTTAVGRGIAFPHARSGLIGVVEEPVLVLARPLVPIAFGAADGEPVRLVVMFIAPSVTVHLAILARLSRMFRDQQVRDQILTATSEQRVLKVLREAEAKV
jgi:mannitol/fructose-specific phosphotransferase system IIA component (Ntr-type)